MAEPSPTKTSTPIEHLDEDRLLDLGIAPNQLDQFDQPTYHFRLYMMSDEAARTQNFGPSSREHRIVIAETGVTATEIDNVEINSVVGPSKGAGIGITTGFSFTLTQPFGATLLDEIANAADILGIKNYSKAPYYLELSFRGRSRDDTTNAAESDFSNLIWVWPIILTKMAIDINVGGSTYAVDGNLYGDMASTNHIADIDKIISIDATTVGEFFIGFAEELNKREAEKEESPGYIFPDTYSFRVDSDLVNEKIVPDPTDERQNRAATFETVDGKMRISFQAPINIDQIVQNILSLTKYFQTRAKGTDEADAQKKANQGEDAIFQTLYRVIADSEIGKYDNVRKDYQRHHRYLIIPYPMTTVQTQSNVEANVPSADRYAAIYKRGLVTKVYDYIYTGLNDQVLDFDLVFNFNWYAALPLQAGRYTARNTEISAAKTEIHRELEAGNINISDARAAEEKIATQFPSSLTSFSPWSLLDFAKGQLPTNLVDLAEAPTDIINVETLQNSDIIGTVTNQVETVQAGIPAVNEFVSGLPPSDFIPSLDINAASVGAFPIATTESMKAFILGKTQFGRVTDASIDNVDAAQQNLLGADYKSEDQTLGEKDLRVLQTTFIESNPGISQGGTGAYSGSPGQNMLSALFEQANSPLSADLLDITLKIKGDPYWLEPNPIGRNDTPLSIFDRAVADRETQTDANRGGETTFNGVNTSNQQTYFVFRSYSPQQFDAETGITPKNNKDRNALNGVYGVRTVTHSFSGGQFTQELNAIRDPLLNLQGIDLDNPLAPASIASDVDSITAVEPFVDPFASDDVGEFFGLGDTTLGASAVQSNTQTASDLFGKIGPGE